MTMSEMLSEGSRSVPETFQVCPPSTDFHKPPHAAPTKIIFELFGSKAMQFNRPAPPPFAGTTCGPIKFQFAASTCSPFAAPIAIGVNFLYSLNKISGEGNSPLGNVRCSQKDSHLLYCVHSSSSSISFLSHCV